MQVSKGFRPIKAGEVATGYSDVSVGKPGPFNQRTVPGSDADSAMDLSESVHHGAGVPRPHVEGALAAAAAALRPAPDANSDPAKRKDSRTASDAQTNGGSAGSGATPNK